MTRDERTALLLAATIIESGDPADGPLPPDPADVAGEGDHVDLALTLARGLWRVSGDRDRSGQIVASLRAAARADRDAAAA